jgi:hypothetical protein
MVRKRNASFVYSQFGLNVVATADFQQSTSTVAEDNVLANTTGVVDETGTIINALGKHLCNSRSRF